MSSSANPTETLPAPSQKKFFGQPWGLANLFGIELWERFSFYGMQSLLAFYLYYSVTEGGLGMSEAAALSIVGAYGGFVYMNAIVASFVADRLIGSERTLFYSSILVMAGHVALAVLPGFLGLTVGLVCVAVGSGGVKTAASVVLGQLYSKEDPRRDAGFSIFYMAVNIGAFFGPMITGALSVAFNFHVGFGAAAVGMALGLTQYVLMRKTTIGAAGHDVPNPLPKKGLLPVLGGLAVVVLTFVMLVATGIIKLEWLANIMLGIALVALVAMMIQMLTSSQATEAEKSRLVGFIPMMLGAVAFFAIFQSQFTILAVYADQRLDLNLFGWEMAPSQVTSFNPVFIVLFAGVFAAIWTKLGKRQPSTAVKFGIASIIIGVSLFFFLPFTTTGEDGTPIFVVIWILFLFTMGELMLSPVGNSLATKVAPEKFQSQTMAVWLLAVSMGTSLSGTLGGLYNPNDPSAEFNFFLWVGIGSIVIGLIMIALKGWVLKKFIDVH
ncbi:peptide MFS transporter [Corynebacterium uterequi]|uniref:Amino acid/peptide transporter (Peptide:H symporter) n=1 Tax=Corynebacterium uterequi TaxID=1072256 RepID=A0A0G3HFR9_9CORY|nr:peptide MFS transporter [Corynebacterium uterequi]AKK12161.1 amino acid/peptide transporter (peptide:H symporter) [Corynebacterium uterequi]